MLNKLALSSSLRGRPLCGLVSQWDMYKFDAATWLRMMEQIAESVSEASRAPQNTRVVEVFDGSVERVFNHLGKICHEVGLETASTLAYEMKGESQAKDYTVKQYCADLSALKRTVIANMRSIKFMRVSSEYARYLEDGAPLELHDHFPTAAAEIESAGDALAYGLGTASVFHLMRAMEVGLRAFAAHFEIDYAPSWDAYFKRLNTKFDQKHVEKSEEWKQDEPFYKDVYGDLHAVKVAWRNKTMHIDREYSQSEAREVYSAVNTFLIRLSEKISEPDDDEEDGQGQ